MRLILFDEACERRGNFYPLALSRPIWELRCGITSLAEKLISKVGAADVACFVPPYLAQAYRARASLKAPVNDPATLAGEDLLLVNGRLKAAGFNVAPTGPSEVGLAADGECLYVRITKADLIKLKTDTIETFLSSAKKSMPTVTCDLPRWNYTWELVLANSQQIIEDFAAAGRNGIEGTLEQPSSIRGDLKDVYIGDGAVVHPMVVIEAVNGPVYIDEGAHIYPFTRIEGPCYIGKGSMLFGAKCREGNSIGPVCRVGGEIEESIIQGYSNKYHDGFLGYAYVGEWVNLGAQTNNSDLKNDYSSISVVLNGRQPIDTGATKMGSLIGDHTKTSIGTLLNTGSYVGAMTLIITTGKLLPKFIPSFTWFLDGVVGKGFGKSKLYETAKISMGRRNCEWTAAEEAMWDSIFEITAPVREKAIRRRRIRKK